MARKKNDHEKTEDKEATKKFVCPMCSGDLHRNAFDAHCNHCGSLSAGSAAELAKKLKLSDLSPDKALRILNDFESHFWEDWEHGLWWGHKATGTSEADSLAFAFSAITGPSSAMKAGSIPLIVDAGSFKTEATLRDVLTAENAADVMLAARDDNDGLASLPTCRHCRHVAILDDTSNSILGVDKSFVNFRTELCVFPCVGSELVKANAAAFERRPEKIRGYQTNEEGVLRNILADAATTALQEVESQERGLEAWAGDPINAFFGPICANFALDKEHDDFAYDGFETLSITVPVQFGVADVKRGLAD